MRAKPPRTVLHAPGNRFYCLTFCIKRGRDAVRQLVRHIRIPHLYEDSVLRGDTLHVIQRIKVKISRTTLHITHW
jgi:hypothetical protein